MNIYQFALVGLTESSIPNLMIIAGQHVLKEEDHPYYLDPMSISIVSGPCKERLINIITPPQNIYAPNMFTYSARDENVIRDFATYDTSSGAFQFNGDGPYTLTFKVYMDDTIYSQAVLMDNITRMRKGANIGIQLFFKTF